MECLSGKVKMMMKVESYTMINLKRVISFFLAISFVQIHLASANDLGQVLSGDEVEDSLGKVQSTETSPYLIQSSVNEIETQKIKSSAIPDFIFSEKLEEVSVKENSKNKFQDLGYTMPGSLEAKENYTEIDKYEMASEFRNQSSGAINITFIRNEFVYDSANDIINKTINEGYKHVKGGALYIRGDQYLFRTIFLNSFWCVGAGVGYNSGRGLFVNGERSETTFRLWEIPVDVGLGLEIPIYHWFKISGSLGPSATALYQNRNDFQSGEKGRNKIQVSYGQFANAQFRINLTGFSADSAYKLFADSKITNLYMNLEARYQKYQKFQDTIKISGQSYGIGFTFEYL